MTCATPGERTREQVREYAAAHAMTDVDALRAGMREKSEEFRRKGEIYVKS